MSTRGYIFITLFGIGWVVLTIRAAPLVDKASLEKEMEELIARLPAASKQEEEQIALRFGAMRAEIQTQLILQLLSPKSKQHQVVIVYLLGLYRMDAAARELTKIITLETELMKHKRLPLWGRYPVVDALIRIGMPSVRAVMERLERTEDDRVIELGTMVIDRILGRELGEMALKQAIDKQTDPDKRKKLEEALEFFKNKLRR